MTGSVVSLPSRESAAAKGRRYLVEGRLSLLHVSDKLIIANCHGDQGDTYTLGYDFNRKTWRCDCPARGVCAHIVALALVVEKPA